MKSKLRKHSTIVIYLNYDRADRIVCIWCIDVLKIGQVIPTYSQSIKTAEHVI